MDTNEYQKLAGRTLLEVPDNKPTWWQWGTVWCLLEGAVALGKTVELAKKIVCHQRKDLGKLHHQTFLPQNSAVVTVPEYSNFAYMIVWNLLGLVGEAAELTEVCLTAIQEGVPIPTDKFRKEAGDVAWYWAALHTKLEIFCSDSLRHNVDNLVERYPEGYTAERSSFREGIAE